jgi:hypothetical protein
MSTVVTSTQFGITAQVRATAWYGRDVLKMECQKQLEEFLGRVSELPSKGDLRIRFSGEVTE